MEEVRQTTHQQVRQQVIGMENEVNQRNTHKDNTRRRKRGKENEIIADFIALNAILNVLTFTFASISFGSTLKLYWRSCGATTHKKVNL